MVSSPVHRVQPHSLISLCSVFSEEMSVFRAGIASICSNGYRVWFFNFICESVQSLGHWFVVLLRGVLYGRIKLHMQGGSLNCGAAGVENAICKEATRKQWVETLLNYECKVAPLWSVKSWRFVLFVDFLSGRSFGFYCCWKPQSCQVTLDVVRLRS